MEKLCLIFLLCYLIPVKAYCFDISEEKTVLFVFKDKHTVCIYNTADKDSIVAKIFNDGKLGLLNGFEKRIEKRILFPAGDTDLVF